MSKALVKKILQHPDKDDIISRLVSGEKPVDVAEWLRSKYGSDIKFALGSGSLKLFQDEHLDVYLQLKEDILTVKASQSLDDKLSTVQLDSRIKNNKKYRERLDELADKEIDIKKVIKLALVNLEARAEQVFDHLQENSKDFKVDHVLIQYFNTLIMAIEKCDKLVNNAPDQVIQHNHTIKLADQQMAIFVDTVRDIIKTFDYEQSLMFTEMFYKRIAVLDAPEEFKPIPVEIRLAEAKLLGEKIIEKT